jgi:hypothetical protein
MAMQAVSNLIYDWNREKQAHEIVDDLPIDILKT